MLILKIFWSNHFISIRYGQLCYLISSYFILCQLILSYHIVGLISVTSLCFSIYHFSLVFSSKSEMFFSCIPLFLNLFLEGGHKFFIGFIVESKSFDFIRSVQIFASPIFSLLPLLLFYTSLDSEVPVPVNWIIAIIYLLLNMIDFRKKKMLLSLKDKPMSFTRKLLLYLLHRHVQSLYSVQFMWLLAFVLQRPATSILTIIMVYFESPTYFIYFLLSISIFTFWILSYFLIFFPIH